jgi:hypothetical protein
LADRFIYQFGVLPNNYQCDDSPRIIASRLYWEGSARSQDRAESLIVSKKTAAFYFFFFFFDFLADFFFFDFTEEGVRLLFLALFFLLFFFEDFFFSAPATCAACRDLKYFSASCLSAKATLVTKKQITSRQRIRVLN